MLISSLVVLSTSCNRKQELGDNIEVDRQRLVTLSKQRLKDARSKMKYRLTKLEEGVSKLSEREQEANEFKSQRKLTEVEKLRDNTKGIFNEANSNNKVINEQFGLAEMSYFSYLAPEFGLHYWVAFESFEQAQAVYRKTNNAANKKNFEQAEQKMMEQKDRLIATALSREFNLVDIDIKKYYVDVKEMHTAAKNMFTHVERLWEAIQEYAGDVRDEKVDYDNSKKDINEIANEIFQFGENWTVGNTDKWNEELTNRFNVVKDKCFERKCNFDIDSVKNTGLSLGVDMFLEFLRRYPAYLRCKDSGGNVNDYFLSFLQFGGIDLVKQRLSGNTGLISGGWQPTNPLFMNNNNILYGDGAVVILYQVKKGFYEQYEKDVTSKCFRGNLNDSSVVPVPMSYPTTPPYIYNGIR